MRGPAGASEWYDRSVRVFPSQSAAPLGSPIEGAKRRKKAAFGAPSVRKGLQ